jgi:benzylsuccinate CoA-transferase BbsE subunit
MIKMMTAGSAGAPAAGLLPLDGFVVLDLSGALGNYCGKLFADLGADVILVEPLTGSPTRRMEPKMEGRSDVEASLHFQYNNTNKRSVAIDLDRPEGQALFRSLVARAHLVIETERPGVMEARGLGYQALRAIAPHIVMSSITPFGQKGPYAQWQAEDIVGLALGGMMSLGGYFDSPPMAAFGYQAFAAANLFGAVASMAALYDAEVSGTGQHVDVSMQECVVMGMENAVQFFDLEGTVRKRNAGQQRQAGTGVFACKDGYVYLMAGGIGANRFWATTVQWLMDEAVEGAEQLKESCWSDMDYLATDEAKEAFKRIFSSFAQRTTKLELYTRGQQRRIPIAPISNTADILQSKQLQDRGFFVQAPTDTASERPMLMPGAPYKLSATPWSLRRNAPKLGEHTSEILGALGINDERRITLQQQGIVG